MAVVKCRNTNRPSFRSEENRHASSRLHQLTALVVGISISLLPALLALPGDSQSGAVSTSSIHQTRDRVSQIEAALSHEQQQSAYLSQQFDKAEQSQAVIQTKLTETAAQIAQAKTQIAAEKKNLTQEAIRAYEIGDASFPASTVFSSTQNGAVTQGEYVRTAIGNMSATVDSLKKEQSQLVETAANQKRQEEIAAKDAADAKKLETENIAESNATQATLASVKGKLAAEVAQAARDRAIAAAQQAARAQSAAAAQAAAEEAQQAASVAGQLGGAKTVAAAQTAANQAVSSANGQTGTGTVSVHGGSSGSSAGESAVHAAESQLGVPYVWGGEAPGVGFDCSGLTQWSWSKAGVSIPRVALTQYRAIPSVSLDSLEPGDLLFYSNLDGTGTIDHVVMYVGSGPYGSNTVIEAPYTGANVTYAPVSYFDLAAAGRP